MASEGRRRMLITILVMVQLLLAISFVNAEGFELRQQIMEKLQATPKPKQTPATNPPTPKPTKHTTSPTSKPTKPNPITAAPTLHKTKSPTAAPTKKAALQATNAPVVTAAPTKKTSKSPTAKQTSVPAVPKATLSPTKKQTKSPSQAKVNGNGASTSSPSKAKTKAPTTDLKSSIIATTPSKLPTNSPTEPLVHTDAPVSSTSAPSALTSMETSAPSESAEILTPTVAPTSATDSPSTATDQTMSPSSSEEAASPAPTASPAGVVATESPSAESTTSPTASPTTVGIIATTTTSSVDGSNATTSSPSSAPSTATEQPTSEGTSSPASVVLKVLNVSMSNVAAPLFNWTAQAQYELYLVKVTGISSRAAAGNAILALKRMCTQRTDNATAELTLAIQDITSTVLPELKSNRSSCDDLLKYQEAESDRPTRERLEYASASAAMVIKAQQRLVDISQIVLSGNTTSSCDALVNPQVTELRQYDVQTEMDSINTANIVLASLALVLSLILMVLHPLIDGWGSMTVFVVAASYVWGYAAFMAGWYAFQLNEVSAWVASTWWRDFYSVYLMGLAAWLLFLCLFAMIYFILQRYPWLMGMFAGIAVGAVLGIQVNTIGVWQLGYSDELPQYFTHACCMGVGAGLFAFAFALWSGLAPTAGGMQHITAMFIGSYLFIKSIGVLAGSYPNEFDMEPPQAWETYVYISAMWLLFILCLIFQTFVYGIFTPVQRRSGPKKQPNVSKRKEYTEEEKAPLLTEPVGTASDSRNRLRQQEVVEFGGIRALRSEQENRKLYV